MNLFYAKYIATAQALAGERGLRWELEFDEKGIVSKATRWNLTAISGMLPPPVNWLGKIGVDEASFEKLNVILREKHLPPIPAEPMQKDWREFYQAVFLDQLLLRKSRVESAKKMAMGVRRLAQVAGNVSPWAVTAEHIQLAYNAVLQSSDKGALDFVTMLKTVIDSQRLADIPNLARFCIPYPSQNAQAAHERAILLRTSGGKKELRRNLSERKAAAKLPDERAFWELVRIVFTETPRSFSDAIRFAAFRLQIIMGFRIGEVATLPVDWKRWREYVDADGRLAGEHGGFSTSLMIRHFAEKQEEDGGPEGHSLYENTQHVPRIFENILIETLDYVERITAPLRDRLRQQCKTGRIFPEYDPDELVPAWDMYVRMTGNAAFSDKTIPSSMIEEYRAAYDPRILDEIRELQLRNAPDIVRFWNAPGQRTITIRDPSGLPYTGRINWRTATVRVGEIEQHIKLNSVTKLSETTPTTITDGTRIDAHELMFLVPIRDLIETRNGGVLDVTLYSAVGRIDVQTLYRAVGRGDVTKKTLFERYGRSDEDRLLSLVSHSLRHLQNTELFRLGVADTIITKKFNRRSVQQSYVYDHRSLAEDLADIDLPPEVESQLGEKAMQVFKLISANKARGPVVDEFLRVQREYGDEAAFDYLNAEADGLHVTPYGLCMNSFTSDPCPKHLECFNGCLHLARTDVISEQENLERMRDKFAKVIISLEALPEDRRNIGWANQLTHARVRYENIVKALGTEPGMQAFPNGQDLSVTAEQNAGTTIIDTMKRLRDLDD